jgi:pyridoxamine 5'-phosphate oxidase
MKEMKFITRPDLSTVRKEYDRHVLLEEQCDADPFNQFERWLLDAMEMDSHFANAVTLCTTGKDGMPNARTVLLRNVSYGGLTFYTNYKSRKAQEIERTPKACMLFFWKELERQVKIQGELRLLPEGESDRYFESRPFESKVGAWASVQSSPIKDRASLDELYRKELEKYSGGHVPRPPHWGGYVLLPSRFEFWQGRASRLHDRIQYERQADHSWLKTRLMP